MTPLVSVVMAAKNYARFLPEAVDSVLAQTYPHWELLIVDDGSTDATPHAVQPYLCDPRVRYFRSDRLGQPRAKNLGLGLSRGEFIAYLDADDAWEADKLRLQVDLLSAAPQVGVCFTLRSLMDENGQRRPAIDGLPPRGRVLEALFLKNFVCFSSVMIRRSVFDHVGRFDPEWDLAIDYDFWLRVARHYEFDYVPQPLVRYRTGHGNLSKKLSDRVATALSIMTRAVDRRGLRSELPAAAIAEGYVSTALALAYTVRAAEPGQAARWYTWALAWPGQRWQALRGLLACARAWWRGPCGSVSGENAAANR